MSVSPGGGMLVADYGEFRRHYAERGRSGNRLTLMSVRFGRGLRT
jgi:hypothetical protein